MNLDRWALNKTFDNVRWRTERCINPHQCEIFDTCELQPWLSHRECEHDIRRADNIKVTTSDYKWFDANTNQDIPAPIIPDCSITLAYKEHIAIGQRRTVAGAVQNHHVFAPGGFDEANGVDRGTISLFHYTLSDTGARFLEFDYADKTYGGPDEGYVVINAQADPFTAVNNGFWNGVNTMTAGNGEFVRANVVAASLRVLIWTTSVQSDGFCYRDGALGATPILHNAGAVNRRWLPLEIQVGNVWVLTDLVVAIPMFRIARGATQMDLNVQD